MLGLFAIVSVFLSSSEEGNDRLSLVGGFFAYAFIAFAVIVAVVAWRGKSTRDAHRLAERFLEDHAAVTRVLGDPVDVRLRPGRTAQSPNGGRMTIPAEIGGPLGEGSAETIVERAGEQWRVVGGDLEFEDQHVALAAD